MKTEAYFIGHCDEPGCDLGSFDYTCPSCNKDSSDYDVWWKEDEIYKGTPELFKCQKCLVELKVTYDQEENEMIVTIVELEGLTDEEIAESFIFPVQLTPEEKAESDMIMKQIRNNGN